MFLQKNFYISKKQYLFSLICFFLENQLTRVKMKESNDLHAKYWYDIAKIAETT